MDARKGTRLWKLAGLLTVATLAFAPAQAGPAEQDLCGQGGAGHGEGSDLCAVGPAGCVAIGLRVDISPSVLLPGGATVELSRSVAHAFGYYGFGYGHGDAHQMQATVSPSLGTGAIESDCNAYSTNGFNYAWGQAETTRLAINLLPAYGIPVTLNVDVLKENGSSMNGAGGNAANIVDVSGSVFFVPIGPIGASAPANTTISLGPVGTLYLNEQTVAPGFCPVYNGDALRLVVNDPLSGAQVAQVLISWVSTSTCP